MPTKYKILSKNTEGFWIEHAAPIEAVDDIAAIRKAIDGDANGLTYVAVPLRSFRPRVVTVETNPKVTIADELPI